MEASLFLLFILNTFPTASEKFYPCAVVYDGGGLTAQNLVVKGNVAVRKLAGQKLAAQVSTVIVSKGCVVAAYEDTKNDEQVFKFGSSCTADVLEQSTVIDSDTLDRTIQSIHCFCVRDCKNCGALFVLVRNYMSLLLAFSVLYVFS